MTPDELIRHLESLLFVAAEPAEIAQLASALGVKAGEVDEALEELAAEYRTRGIRLQRKGQRVQLASAPDAAPYVEKFLGLTATTRLSQAALETLAIIAYRQPITRAEIEALRGVDCDGVLRTLAARQLIIEIERLETVGHPIRYGTTFEFLRYFGLQRLDEMPPLRVPEQPTVPAPDDAAPSLKVRVLEPISDEQETTEIAAEAVVVEAEALVAAPAPDGEPVSAEDSASSDSTDTGRLDAELAVAETGALAEGAG